MKRFLLAVAVALLSAVVAVAQDRIVLQTPIDEIDLILEVIDELEPIRALVLEEGGRFTDRDIDTIVALANLAELYGADDVAAEARMLAVIAGKPRGSQESVAEEALLTSEVAPEFDVRNFQRLINITATVGITSFALSALYHYLAEQTYERYMNPLYTSPEYFQQYKTYDLLSVSLGAASFLTLGVGVPLTFAAPGLWNADTSVPQPKTTYTEEERLKRLEQLLVRRARVSETIRNLPAGPTIPEIITTWSFVAGGVGFVVSVASFYIADSFYGQYLDATTTADAEGAGNMVRLFDFVGAISGIVSGAGFGTAAGVEIFTRNKAELEGELQSINEEIITLRLAAPLPDEILAGPASGSPASAPGATGGGQ